MLEEGLPILYSRNLFHIAEGAGKLAVFTETGLRRFLPTHSRNIQHLSIEVSVTETNPMHHLLVGSLDIGYTDKQSIDRFLKSISHCFPKVQMLELYKYHWLKEYRDHPRLEALLICSYIVNRHELLHKCIMRPPKIGGFTNTPMVVTADTRIEKFILAASVLKEGIQVQSLITHI